jgi:hypothetical protein
MSNYLAIATVTAALQRILQAAIQFDVEGARVTTLRPDRLGQGTPDKGVNLYLYQVERNGVWQSNADLKSRSRKGENGKKNHTALDLNYMISVYGSEVELEPQRLLGSVVGTLSDCGVLNADTIRETIRDPNYTYLADSDLGDRLEDLRFVPLDLSVEDLSKIWSVFFQTPYTLSIAYQATAVTIEGDDAAHQALPVRDRALSRAAPFWHQPVIDEAIARGGRYEPILTGSTLQIRGKHLNGRAVRVRLGDVEVTPPETSDTQIYLPLSMVPAGALRLGVQTVQAIYPDTVESNAMPFVLRPTVVEVRVLELEGDADELRSGVLTVRLDVPVMPQQQVIVALNERAIDHPSAYLFRASRRSRPTPNLRVPLREVKPGQYLIRARVDGAESPLEIDRDPNSPTFNWYVAPTVTLA